MGETAVALAARLTQTLVPYLRGTLTFLYLSTCLHVRLFCRSRHTFPRRFEWTLLCCAMSLLCQLVGCLYLFL